MILGYFLIGLGLLFGMGSYETRLFERKAAADIRSELQGEHAHVEVRTRAVGLSAASGHLKQVTITASRFSTAGLPLFTEPQLSKSGKIDDLRILLHDFELRGLRIESLESEFPDCRFDFGLAVGKRKIRLSQCGVGTGSVTILENDLEAFILKKYHEIKTVHVKVGDGKLHVWGYGEFLIISTNFDVVASLDVQEGNKLTLADATIIFDGKPAEDSARNALLHTLNPIVDLNRDLALHDAIYVTKISLADGRIVAGGATQVPVDPSAADTKSVGTSTPARPRTPFASNPRGVLRSEL